MTYADETCNGLTSRPVETLDITTAVEFLDRLRLGGPWLLTAIEPDGPSQTETITAFTSEEAARFVRANNGRKNLYYSVNPTRSTSAIVDASPSVKGMGGSNRHSA